MILRKGRAPYFLYLNFEEESVMAIVTVQGSIPNPSSDWRIPRSIALALALFITGYLVGLYVFGFGLNGRLLCGLVFFILFCFGMVEYVRFYGIRSEAEEDSSANSSSKGENA